MWRSDPEPRAVSVAIALLTLMGGSLVLLGLAGLVGLLALPGHRLAGLLVLPCAPAGALMILTAARLGPGTRAWWAAAVALLVLTPSVDVLDRLVTGERIGPAAFGLPVIGLACLLSRPARRYAFAVRAAAPEGAAPEEVRR